MKKIASILLSVFLLLSLLVLPQPAYAAWIYDEDYDPFEGQTSTLIGFGADDITIVEGSYQDPEHPGRYDLEALLPELSLYRIVIPPEYTGITEPVELYLNYQEFVNCCGDISVTEPISQEEEPWGLGRHTIVLSCVPDDMDEAITASVDVIIAENPVASIQAEDRFCIINWDDLAPAAADGTKQYQVNFDSPNISLQLKDGTVLTGDDIYGFAWEYHQHPSFSAADDGAWINQPLAEGQRHTAVCSFFQLTAEYDVIPVATPVETFSLPEEYTVYYSAFDPNWDLVDEISYTLREDAEYVPGQDVIEHVNLQEYIRIILPDGSFYEYGCEVPKEDMTLTFNFLGLEKQLNVHFLPSPVASVRLENNVLWQEADEEKQVSTHDWSLCGFRLDILPLVVTFTDGSELKTTMDNLYWQAAEHVGAASGFRLSAEDESVRWDLGEHSFTLHLFGAEYPLTVSVIPKVIADFTLEDATLDVHTGGSWQQQIDAETGEVIPDQVWYRYDAPIITVYETDGDTFTGTAEEVSEHYGRAVYVNYASSKKSLSRDDELPPEKYEVTVLFGGMMDVCQLKILPDISFTDVAKDAYYAVPVAWATKKGITSGTGDNKFSPKSTCTREQVITFLYAAAGRPEHTLTESPFTDVRPGSYYYDAVLWAYENGIANGVRKDLFGVKKPCTREQVVTFLWNAAGKPEHYSWGMPFSDVHPGKYYYEAVLWANENGITSGVSETEFGVRKSCTRAQIVTFLYAAYGWQGADPEGRGNPLCSGTGRSVRRGRSDPRGDGCAFGRGCSGRYRQAFSRYR